MEPQRRNLLGMAGAGVLFILMGLFSGSWISGSAEEGAGTVMRVGLTSGTRCVGGQCTGQDPGNFDENLGYVGMLAILAGLIAAGATAVAAYWILKRREVRIDPKKLGIPVGAGAACAAGFLFVGHQSAHLTPGWSGIVALLGFGAAAGSMFLAKQWLPNAPVMDQAGGWAPGAPQGWNAQPPGGYAPPHGGYAPPQGGYAPPQGGYAPPQRPVQPVQQIQPTMPAQPMQPQPYAPPAMPYGAPGGGYVPPSQPPMMPGAGQAPPPMTPQPFTPQRPASSSQPPVAMMSNTIPPGANPCPKCATGLAYSSQYGKWYCARCREYM